VFYLGVRIGLIVSGSAAVVFFLLSGQLATSLYHDSSLVPLILVAMVIFLPSQTILVCLYGAFQGSHMMKYTALVDLVFQVSKIIIAILLVLVGLGSFGIMVAMTIASIGSVSVGFRLAKRLLYIQDNHNVLLKMEDSNLRHVMRFSFFNYLATGMATLGFQIGYIILGTQSFDSVAFFGISALISGIVSGITNSVGRAILPTTSEQMQQGTTVNIAATISSAFRLSIMASGFIYIILIIAPGSVLSLLSNDYKVASQALIILVIEEIVASLMAFIRLALNGIGRPEWGAKISMIWAAIVIISMLILVPHYNLVGAASSVLIGSLVGLMLSLYYGKKGEILSGSYLSILKPILTASIAIVIGFTSLFATENIAISVSLAIASYVLLIKAFKVTTTSEVKELISIGSKVLRSGAK
jgi:O-antigen/teichoic acid export membrane protein